MARTVQNYSEDDTSPVQELTFHVPQLRQSPTVGGGCCALPAGFLIEEALGEAEGVGEVDVSERDGLVSVWASATDPGLRERLKSRIEDLGYRVEEAQAPVT